MQRGSRGWGVFIHGNHAARRENISSWWGCLCGVCFASKKSSEQEFFIPAGTHLGVELLTTPTKYFIKLVKCISLVWYVIPLLLLGANMSTQALFAMKCKKPPALVCPIDAIRASACLMVAFSGFHESPVRPPLGNVLSIIPPHRNRHRSG